MKEELKESLLLKLFKFGLILIISWIIVLIAVAILTSGSEIDPKYDKYTFLGGILLSLAITFIRDYNIVQDLKAKIPKLKADIESVKKMRNSLLNKANRVADKYIIHESDVMNNIADSRKNTSNISMEKATLKMNVETASDFKSIIENYPDLKANAAIMKLLDQLEVSEVRLLKNRTDYSTYVSKYNARIHTFPFSLIRRLLKLEDIPIIDDEIEIVSDEELGI